MTDYDTRALERWRHYSDVPLLILAGAFPLLLLGLVRSDLTRGDRIFLDVVNVIVLVAFLVDYVVEMWLARPRGRYVRAEWTSLLIVVAQALALAPEASSVSAPSGVARWPGVAGFVESPGSSRSSSGSPRLAAPRSRWEAGCCAATRSGSPSAPPV